MIPLVRQIERPLQTGDGDWVNFSSSKPMVALVGVFENPGFLESVNLLMSMSLWRGWMVEVNAWTLVIPSVLIMIRRGLWMSLGLKGLVRVCFIIESRIQWFCLWIAEVCRRLFCLKTCLANVYRARSATGQLLSEFEPLGIIKRKVFTNFFESGRHKYIK